MIAATVVRTILAPTARAFRRALSNPRHAQDRVLRNITGSTDYAAFTRQHPLVTYDDLHPIAPRVTEPILFHQLTSGSTAAAKCIPVTRSLQRSFTRAVALWLHDILTHVPLETGRFYYGAADDGDLAYVGGPLQALIRRYLVRLDEEPEIVSVWNPSFLLTKVTRPMPSVKLVSCWAAADAARGAEALRELFPNALIQPKGLLATEAPVTIPLFDAEGFVPLVGDVFLELFDGTRVRRLEEAELGAEYELIVSQRAGLVRYRLGDRVRATHRFLATPCLEFLGRADDVCDLAGEKLSEGFARSVVAAVTRGFGVLVPDRASPGYVLIVDRDGQTSPEELLLASPRYREARRNGQLAAARVVVDRDIERRLTGRKPAALIRDRAVAASLVETHAPALQ